MSQNYSTTDLIPYLKSRGLRITPQRMLILQTILELNNHPTVEDIHLKLPSISVATIYNNVKMFVQLGILNELPYGHGLSKYEWKTDDHYHVICQHCGKIEDFNYPLLKEVEQMANHLTKFSVRSHQLEIYGTCQQCLRSL